MRPLASSDANTSPVKTKLHIGFYGLYFLMGHSYEFLLLLLKRFQHRLWC